MRILMINSVCGIRSTGRICTDIAELLENQGHKCKIAYGRESIPEKYQKYAVKIGGKIDLYGHVLKARLFDGAGFGSKYATRKLIKFIKEYAPDIIHLHFVTNVLMCRLALKKDKTPRLFQVPGPLHLENALTSFIERRTATEVDYWAGACKKTCSIYRDKGIDSQKIHLAYYGVPQKEILNNLSKTLLRSEYGISKDSIVIAMVSYFYKPKK